MKPEESSLFADLLEEGEEWLMRRILHYSILHDYTRFTSTAEEAWRTSITGISNPFVAMLRAGKEVLPIECQEELELDAATEFGRVEAKKHRVRGIPLNLFLGLFKYYRRSYLDYLEFVMGEGRLDVFSDKGEVARKYGDNIVWYFDRIEIAFCSEWSGLDQGEIIQDLQKANRELAVERNKYLTIFDSLHEPVFYLREDGAVDKANSAAHDLFPELKSAHSYYEQHDAVPLLPELREDFGAFVGGESAAYAVERDFPGLPGAPRFRVLFHKLLDFSQKFTGATLILSDITRLHQALEEAEKARGVAQDALRFLQRFLDALPVPIFFKDNQGRYRLVNREFCGFAGRSKEEIVGGIVGQFFPEDLAESLIQADKRLYLDTDMLRQEVDIRFPGRPLKRFEIFKTRLKGGLEPGEFDGIVGACFDITERSITTEELKKRVVLDESIGRLIHTLLRGMKDEIRFGEALEILGEGYGVCRTCVFRVEGAKQEGLRLVEEWVNGGESHCGEADFFAGSFVGGMGGGLMGELAGGGVVEGGGGDAGDGKIFSYLVAPIFLERTEGRHFWGVLVFSKSLGSGGEKGGWGGNERDIAKASADLLGAFLTRSEEVELQRLLGAAVESAEEAIVVTDAQLQRPGPHILFANPAAERNSGYKREELIGKSPRIFQGPNTNREALRHLREDLPEGKPFRAISTNYRKDGTPFLIDWNIAPVRDAAGNITHYVSIQRDITQQHEMEQRLSLASKMESIGSLSAGIAHEINSPAQFIGDNVQYALETVQKMAARLSDAAVELPAGVQKNLFGEVPAALKDAMDGLERVRKIVHSMKEFAHPSEDFSSTDLNRCIETSATICRNEWKHHAKVVFDFDEEMPQVFCVRSDISQVVVNLVINAAQAIAEKNRAGELGNITIRTRRKGEDAHIEVEDDGPGIPEKFADKIFDPFFTTKPVGKGTGQGLFLASQSVVGKHGGHITVANRQGGGAVFSIQIPIRAS